VTRNQRTKETMQVAILAGGLATRLRPLSEKLPKSLIHISGKPFLHYQLDFLKRNGITRVVLCTGYLGEQIEDYFRDGRKFGVHIEYSRESEQLLGTAGALKKAQPLLDREFFTMYGDSYLFLDFGAAMRYFRSQNKLALMTVYKNFDRYDRSNTVIERNLVKKFSKKEKTEDMVYIEYGVNVFKKEALEMVPEDQPYSLDDLFPSLIEQGELLAFEVKERFYEIGSISGLKEFEEFVKSGKPVNQ
jgi:MurNAc alpha-1-phosphate uridylyltransferase